jgi:VCBS repeat-containing protein
MLMSETGPGWFNRTRAKKIFPSAEKKSPETKKSRPRRIGIMALEPRMMYDGAAAATVGAVAQAHPDAALDHAAVAAVADKQTVAVTSNTAADTQAAAPNVPAPPAVPGTDNDKATPSLDASTTAASASSTIRELVVIDSRVAGIDQLLGGVKPGDAVLILDPEKDGVQQIADAIAANNLHDLTAIQIVSHGTPGAIDLGSNSLSDASLASHADALAAMGASLAPGGDILLYGCDVAAGSAGAQFIADLAARTGANVAASTDATGSSALGGNWTLEAKTGAIDATLPFSDATRDAYTDLLVDPIDNHQSSLVLTQLIVPTGTAPVMGGHGGGFPIAAIRTFAGDYAFGDSLLADGQIKTASSNTVLFSLLGASYGGNGITTFGLPDLVGRIMIGRSSSDAIGSEKGAATVSLAVSNLPSEGGVPFNNDQPSLAITYGILVNKSGSATTDLVGQIIAFAGNFSPGDYLPCDGRLLSIAQNIALFSTIGNIYGGDGDQTFALPDLRGRAIMGATSDSALGTVVGQDSTTIAPANLPITMGGSQTAAENRQPSLELNYIIATSGLFPTRGSTPLSGTSAYLGEVVAFSGTVNSVPAGWMLCDGSTLAIAQDQFLFALLGTHFGGNGVTNFQLPDLRNHVVIGADQSAFLTGQAVGSNTITLTASNTPHDAAPVLDVPTDSSPANSVLEQGGAVHITTGAASVGDAELDALNGGQGNYGGAVLTVARQGGADGADSFGFDTAAASFTVSGGTLLAAGKSFGSFTNTGGTLTIRFNAFDGSGAIATRALVNDVLRHISYGNTSDVPPTLVVSLSDGNTGAQGPGGAQTGSATVTPDITPVNDAPTFSVSANASYIEGGTAAALDPNLVVSDVDGGPGFSATVRISGAIVPGDLLTGGGTYNALTRVFTTNLASNASLAALQADLRALTFSSTAAGGPRTLFWTISDGSSAHATVTATTTVDVVTLTAGALVGYSTGGTPAVLDRDIVVTGSSTLTGATVSIADLRAGDMLNFTGTTAITGSYDANAGVLHLTGSASASQYAAALGSVTYSYANGDPSAGGADTSRTINWVVSAGTSNSAAVTSTVETFAVHQPPVVTAGAAVTFHGGGVAVALDPGITLVDIDSGGNLVGAAVQIAGVFGGDTLNFTNTARITGSYNATTGVLTLTGTDTVENYQAALRSVSYSFNPSNGDPTLGGANTSRSIYWIVNDGSAQNGTNEIFPSTTPFVFDNHQPSLGLDQRVVLTGFAPTEGGSATDPQGIPVGAIRTLASQAGLGGTASAAGQLLQISSANAALAAVLGTTYGGDGTTTFRLPDLQDRLAVGYENNPNSFLGAQYGTDTVTLANQNLPHRWGGGDVPFVNDQPSLTVNYIINTGGHLHGGIDALGEVIPFLGTFAPAGYMFADGQLLDITQNIALFSIIGTTYGGDGRTTFALPNLTGRTIIGAGQGAIGDVAAGMTTGQDNTTLTTSNLPLPQGGGQAVSDHQPSLALTYLVATQGLFPSQSATAFPFQPYIGEIIAYAGVNSGLGNMLASGWAIANGQMLPVSQNVALFELIGTTFGGDGEETFALPDLVGRSVAGYTTVSGSNQRVGFAEPFGSDTFTLHSNQVPLPVVATSTLNVVHEPPSVSAGAAATYETGSAPVALDSALTVDDADSGGLLKGATVRIGAGFLSASDSLQFNFTGQTSITFSYDAGAGVLTLSGTDTLADYQHALDTITFSSTAAVAGSRTIGWTVNDGVSGSTEATSTVGVVIGPRLTAGATATFTGGGVPAILDTGLQLTDAARPTLASATISIEHPIVGDTLNFTNTNATTEGNIAVASDANGVLVLTSSGNTATLAQWQTALESVSYSFSPGNGDPTGGGSHVSRTIDWSINDGTATSTMVTSTLNVVHAPPVVVAGNTVTFTGGGAAVLLDGALSVDDVNSGGNLTGATVSIGGFIGGDTLNFADQHGITGHYDSASGILTLTGTDSIANYRTALQSVSYSFSPANGDPTAGDTQGGRAIIWVVKDGVTQNGGAVTGLRTVHVAPVVSAGHAVIFGRGSAPRPIDSALTVNDVDSGGNLTGATVQIIGGALDGDVLADSGVSNGDVVLGNIHATYSSSTRILTLTGTDTVANYQAALQQVTYGFSPTTGDPTDGGADTSRNIQWTVSDSASTSTSAFSTINVVRGAVIATADRIEAGSVSELAGTTGSTALDQATGTIHYTDAITTDINTASASLMSAVWSGGTVPVATMTALASALATPLAESNGSGAVNWTFSLVDGTVDFLAPGQTLTATYQVTVANPNGGSDSSTVTITIAGSNDTPVVTARISTATDTAGIDAGAVVASGGVLAGDSDPDSGDTLSVLMVNGQATNVGHGVAGTYGTLNLAAGGSWAYTANAAFDALSAGSNPVDAFTVTVSDGHGGNADTTLTIAITGGNDTPVVVAHTGTTADTAGKDAGTVVRSVSALNGVLSGDSDHDGTDTLMVSAVNGSTGSVGNAVTGSYGTLNLAADGSYSYTANAAFDALTFGQNRSDTFTVTVSDGHSGNVDTTLRIDITGANDAAVLSNDVRDLIETNSAVDISSSGTLTISDADSPATFAAQTTAGNYGTFSLLAGGGWTYAAGSAHDEFVAGATYTDTFHVASADGTATSVTIHIVGSNDAAVLSSDVRDLTETNSATDISATGTLTISDVDSPATFVAKTTAGSYGTFALLAGGAWTYTAGSAHDEFAAGTTYTDVFSVTSTDGTATSVTIHIAGSNDAAVLSSDVLNLTETDSAADISSSGTLTISDVDSPETFVARTIAGSYGTFALQAGGGWTYTAGSAHDEFAAGTTYTDTFNVTSADRTATSVTIHILGSNDAAVLSSDVLNLTETDSAADISSSGTLTISDVDSPASFVAQTTAGNYGTFSLLAGGGWTYTASSAHDEFAAGTTYTDTFSVASADRTATSVTIHIAGSNDAAKLSSDTRDLTETDSAADISATGTLTVSDIDSPASFAAQTTAGNYGTFSLLADGGWSYAAGSAHDEFAAGTTYSETFKVASADGTLTSVTIHIAGSNDAAVLSSDTLDLTETDSAADISAAGTLAISDVDSPEAFMAQTTVGSYGTFALQADGGWNYTAGSAHDEFVAGTTHTDTFKVTSADGTATSLTIHILGTNDAAVLSSDTRNLTETNSATDINSSGTLTIGDIDSPQNFVAQTTAGGYGTFALQAGGGWTYTASGAHDEFAAGTTYTDTFSVTSADGTATSVTIHIAGTNDAAVLSNDTRNLTETNSAADISSSGTLTVTDIDNPATFLAQTTTGSYGTFALQAGGGWTYTAGSAHDEFVAGTAYADTFNVASSDGTATRVTIHIAGTNDAPVVVAGNTFNFDANAGTPVTIAPAITLHDGDSTTLSGAKVAIAGGLDASHDSLGFVNQRGITGSYDSAAGVLTLSGTASVADYQTALASVTFGSTSTANAGRTIQWTVDDGSALSSQSAAVASTLNVNGVIVPAHLFTDNQVAFPSQNTAPAAPPADGGPSFQLASFTAGDGLGSGGGTGFHVVHIDPVLTTASDATVQINLALAALEAPLGGDVAYVVARQANGDPLPVWLKFDPATGTFAGLPPDNAVASIAPDQSSDSDIVTGALPPNPNLGIDGPTERLQPQTITVEVLVRDSRGNIAVTVFTIDLRAHVAAKHGWNIDRNAHPFGHARHAALAAPELATLEAAVRDVTREPFALRGMPVRHGDAISVDVSEAAPAGRPGLTEQLASIGWRSMATERNALLASLQQGR